MEKSFDTLTVGLSPAIQKTLLFNNFNINKVNRSICYYTDAAGKCINSCRVLIQGGLNASCLTIAGKENRAEFESLCNRDSIDITAIETSGRVRTCTTIVDTEHADCTEIVVDEPEPVSATEEELFRDAFMERISTSLRAVVLSGSRLKGFSEEIIPFMVKEIKSRNLLLFADYKGIDLERSFISDETRPDYVKINEEEFYDSFGSFSDIKSGLAEMSLKYKNVFIISRGAETTLAADNGKIFEIESKRIKAINPTGSGDSMIAGITQGIMEGLTVKQAVEKGRDYGARNALSIHPGWILEDEE